MKKLSIVLVICFALISCFSFGACSSKSEYSVTFMKANNIYTFNQKTNYVFVENKTIYVKKDEVIGSENAPNTTYGGGSLYIFVGWYTDDNFNYLWELNKDEVKSNLTLYPKYQKK